MVEGDSDVHYLEMASGAHHGATGKRLLGSDLVVFSPGTGDSGGTDGIYEEFPALWKIMRSDTDAQGTALYKISLLLDNDGAGRNLFKRLIAQYRALIPWRDVILLQHVMPVRSSEPGAVKRQVEAENLAHSDLNCEIEDFLPASFIEAFVSDHNAFAAPPVKKGAHIHYEFTPAGKSSLCLYARRNCMPADLERLIDALRAVRLYIGLPPDGV